MRRGNFEILFRCILISSNIFSVGSGEQKLECFTISFSSIHDELDRMKERYLNTLANTLHKSIVKVLTMINLPNTSLQFKLQSKLCFYFIISQDSSQVEKFTAEATETLKRQPQTVEEIGEVNAKHAEYTAQMNQVNIFVQLCMI